VKKIKPSKSKKTERSQGLKKIKRPILVRQAGGGEKEVAGKKKRKKEKGSTGMRGLNLGGGIKCQLNHQIQLWGKGKKG